MATLLGVDYGNKKIGFAIGQTVIGTANPLKVIRQNGEMWREIDAIFHQWQPKAVIIGKPELADGKPHPLEKLIENFINELKTRYNAVTYRINEAYTSFEAGSQQVNSRAEKLLDAHAAAILLESWMRTNEI